MIFSEEGVIYKDSAAENYEAGEKALADKNWEEAVKYFNHVSNKYPYSKFAVLAALRVADAHFGDEKYLEAIDSFQTFIKLHPKHEKVPYATFMVARCYYERMPDDWFFLPPVSEKDQTGAIDAQSALEDYLARYPSDSNAAEAKKLLAEVRDRLISNERYAAGFYARQGHWRAVAWRSIAIADKYGDAPDAGEALLRAGEAYEKLGEGKAALRVYQRLQTRYPESAAAKEAADRIKRGIEHPDVDEVNPNDKPASQPAAASSTPAETDDPGKSLTRDDPGESLPRD